MAYFSDADTATNTFTVGKVSIDLQEPSWNPDDTTSTFKDILPNQDIAKDPKIQNDGINDAYVFIEVKVPYKALVTASDSGEKQTSANTQLFTWTVNKGWVEVAKDVTDAQNSGVYTYVYAYVGTDASGNNNTEMLALKANEKTATVFDYVRFANVVEDQLLEATDLDIVVNAYAIQTTNINGTNDATVNGDNADGVTSPADVWSVLDAQTDASDAPADSNEDAETDIKDANK